MSTLMLLPPPLKSSAAIRAASTEPMPLVSWKMPEISFSTPTRATPPEISARAIPDEANDSASAVARLVIAFMDPPSKIFYSAIAGLTRQSIALRTILVKRMDARVKPAHDAADGAHGASARPGTASSGGGVRSRHHFRLYDRHRHGQ